MAGPVVCRRHFLKKIGFGTANIPLSLLIHCKQKASRPPNIIYILADDLGYGDLGCYGQAEIKTPHLDKMAIEGMRFTQHYSGSTVCAPSRCCLMTGLHTGHARVRGNARVPLKSNDLTIAEVMKQRGYATGLIGKWGLGETGSTGTPTKKGFDYFFGYLNQIRAHNYYPDYLWRNEQKVHLKNDIVVAETGYSKGIGSAATKKAEYSHDLFAAEALRFVDKNKGNPFFLYLAYTIPHANNEHWLIKQHGMEVPDYDIYKDKDWPDAQKGHAAMISRMDRDIGNLFSRLRELGIDENTIVMFSSDNGPHKEGGNDPDFNDSNGQLKGFKRDLFEGGIRVPMIARWPGKIKPGSVSHHISAFWDILPTCAELANATITKNIDGISFVPTLSGHPQKEHQQLYWEFHEAGASKQAVRMGEWKAIRLAQNKPLALYNVKADINERKNVAVKYPEIVSKIEKYLETARTENEHWKLIEGN
jgi:arylsulfatase A-like enzyme